VKKILLGLVGALFIGGLVFGAINRTMALGNYPNAGQRFRQQDTEVGIHRGWEGQDGETWYAPRRGLGQRSEGAGHPEQRFGQSHGRQGSGTGHLWNSAANDPAPWH